MDLGLADKTVMITGASGGIGRALAGAFAAEGARVSLFARTRTHALEEWVDRQSWRERARVIQADVRVPDEVDAAVDGHVERSGRFDVGVVNAGVWPPESVRLAELSVERVRAVLEVNLFGAIWSARAFLRALERAGPRTDREGACLVFIGSTAGRFGEQGHAAYAASKAALRGLVLTLKNEIVQVDPHGRVNLVEPGWTVTDMTRRALADEQAVRRSVRTMALRRLAAPEDIASTVLALTSSATARHVTGEILTVAGGMEGRLLWSTGEVDVDAIRRAVE
jgi:3-oxoacyl-[acyl-carrier protein] reductase